MSRAPGPSAHGPGPAPAWQRAREQAAPARTYDPRMTQPIVTPHALIHGPHGDVLLAATLTRIEEIDPSYAELRGVVVGDQDDAYRARNAYVVMAVATAMGIGYPAGFRPDQDPEWEIAYIDLPTGQVSWHIPAYAGKWDGHGTAEKYKRVRAYVESTDQTDTLPEPPPARQRGNQGAYGDV